MRFDCELVGKIGSMALINSEINELDYNTFSRIGKYLQPGYVWVSSGAVEIGKIDYYKRHDTYLNPASLIKAVEGKNVEELLNNMHELFQLCDGASRKGANGMLAKLQYIQEPLKNGTTVIIGSPKYSIPDLINGKVNRTIFRVR